MLQDTIVNQRLSHLTMRRLPNEFMQTLGPKMEQQETWFCTLMAEAE
jgi:hypothetical protein